MASSAGLLATAERSSEKRLEGTAKQDLARARPSGCCAGTRQPLMSWHQIGETAHCHNRRCRRTLFVGTWFWLGPLKTIRGQRTRYPFCAACALDEDANPDTSVGTLIARGKQLAAIHYSRTVGRR